MENKNTFYYSKNIEIHYDRTDLVPQIGDELNICKNEDGGLDRLSQMMDND